LDPITSAVAVTILPDFNNSFTTRTITDLSQTERYQSTIRSGFTMMACLPGERQQPQQSETWPTSVAYTAPLQHDYCPVA